MGPAAAGTAAAASPSTIAGTKAWNQAVTVSNVRGTL
jgi:hypothetical protein